MENVSVTKNIYRTFQKSEICRDQFLHTPNEDVYNETGKETLRILLEGYKKRSKNNLIEVADYGCGDGRLSRFLAKECKNLTCVDISPFVLEATKEKMIEYGNTNASYILGDNFSVEDRYDLICSFQVIQHNPYKEQIQILENIKRALKPNGWALIHLPKLESKPTYQNIDTCMCFTYNQVEHLAKVFSKYEITNETLFAGSEDYCIWVQK